MRLIYMFVAVGLTCLAGCNDKSAGSYGTSVSEAEWDAFAAKQIEAFERQAKKCDEQQAVIDQQNERYDVILDKWEEQQRRFDALLDRWDQILAKAEASE